MRKAIRVRALGAAVALLCWTSRAGCSEVCGAETGRRLSHAGHEIYYEVHGQGPRTLVFIHGWTGSLDTWKYQLGAFPECRRVAIDLPGNGRSSRREDAAYTMCLGIAAIDGAHFEVPADPAGREQWRKETEAMAAGMTSESAREDFIQMLFLPDTPAILKGEVLETSRTVPLVIGRAMIAGVAADLKYWLPKKVEIPCLAVYSPAYQLPPTYRDDFARMYPRVEYHEVQNVSHYFMLEIPYRLNQIISDFVARH